MKKSCLIILLSLLGLSALGCIFLIILILSTGDEKRLAAGKKADNSLQQTLADQPGTMPGDAPDDSGSEDLKPPGTIRRYKRHYTCREMIPGSDLKTLILANDFFCSRSRWSAIWANPVGKGIRNTYAGVFCGDSVVIDSAVSLMWQKYSFNKKISRDDITMAVATLNGMQWHGFSNWRLPTIEEILVMLEPEKNGSGHYLPEAWDCNIKDIWSCNAACDSVSTRWYWVARLKIGRCNYGHPDIRRSLLAVRSMDD